MSEPILVEAECIESTAAGIEYYHKGRQYTIDMVWAKKHGIWRYFRPLREVSMKEAEERVQDEILPKAKGQSPKMKIPKNPGESWVEAAS